MLLFAYADGKPSSGTDDEGRFAADKIYRRQIRSQSVRCERTGFQVRKAILSGGGRSAKVILGE